MTSRRPISVLLVALACFAAVLYPAGATRILWRALVLSWDFPATQAQDELSVQLSLLADPSSDLERAIVPRHDRGAPHSCESALRRSSTACAAGLTRSPPSA